MADSLKKPEKKADKEEEEAKLPLPWRQIQGAIWLIGLAILAWKDWWWPGILVLVALSGLFQAAVQVYLTRQTEKQEAAKEVSTLEQERAGWLPATCPNCGGPLNVEAVRWNGPNTGNCPYCSANLKPERG